MLMNDHTQATMRIERLHADAEARRLGRIAKEAAEPDPTPRLGLGRLLRLRRSPAAG